jgi:hypothetical protein
MYRLVCTLTDWQLLTLTLTLTAATVAAVLEAAGCTALLVALTLVRRGCRSLLSGSVAVAVVAAAAVLAVVVVECLMLALMQMRRLTYMSTSLEQLEVSYFILLFK